MNGLKDKNKKPQTQDFIKRKKKKCDNKIKNKSINHERANEAIT